jgi:hypothetical protein
MWRFQSMTAPGLFTKWTACQAALAGGLVWIVVAAGMSQERPGIPPAGDQPVGGNATGEPSGLPAPEGAKPLFEGGDFAAWVDPDRGVVLIDGQVTLRAGPLEMFACIHRTKEHESVVAVKTQAFPIHAALLALGAEPGHPVQFQPKFAPPAGTEIDIEVRWRDAEGHWQSARAQEWVRNANTGAVLKKSWVFAGSMFWTDPATGRQFYQAESGDFICVSNFATAMLDLPIESTQANQGLSFEAFTEQIPPLGTPVRLVLKPRLDKNALSKPQTPAGSPERDQPPRKESR